MKKINYYLEPIDEEDPTAGYRAVVQTHGVIHRRKFAEVLIDDGLSADVDTVLALFEAQQAAVASLMWEGWDIAVPGYTLSTPWPERMVSLLGGTQSGRVTAGQYHLIQRMIEHGTPHSHSQIEAFFAAQERATPRLVAEGYKLEHPIARIRPTIEGVFDGPDDEFDAERHRLAVKLETEQAIEDWLTGYLEMGRRGLEGPPRPLLDEYEDINTDLTNADLGVGHMVRIRGYWLRFWRPDSRQGLFFVAEDGTLVRRQEVAMCTGLSEVVFVVPRDLPPGAYWLELRSVILPRDGLQRGALPELISVMAEDDE